MAEVKEYCQVCKDKKRIIVWHPTKGFFAMENCPTCNSTLGQKAKSAFFRHAKLVR